MGLAHSGTRNSGARCWWTLACLLPLALRSQLVHAEDVPESVELSWVRAEGAETCPDASAIRAGVEHRLGRNPFGAQPLLSIEAVASHDVSGWTTRIYARRGNVALGTRALDSTASSCDSLGEAVALSIALIIDPEAVARQARIVASTKPATPEALPPAPSPPKIESTRPVSPPVENAATNPAARPSPADETPHVAIDGVVVAGRGLLPGTAWGVDLEGRVPLVWRLALAAGLAFFPEREVTAVGSRFGFGLTTGKLGLCVEPLAPSLVGFELCTLAELGSVHAVVYQPEPTTPGDRLWVAAAASGRLLLRPQRNLRIFLGFGAAFPVAAYRFSVRGKTSPAFAQAQVAGSALFGLGVGF